MQADLVGYFLDWENLVGGLSDKRAAWPVNWARTTAAEGIAVGRDCRAALGRFSFPTTLLMHLLPFLGPIYARAAGIEDPAAWPLPPALAIILKWLADLVEQSHLVCLAQSTSVRAGLRFKTDARAEGDTVIVGGYELPDGCNNLKKVRWFSYRLDTTNAPWAFCENQHADVLTNEASGNFCSNVANRDASGRASLDSLASAGGDSSTAAQRAGGKKDSQADCSQKCEDQGSHSPQAEIWTPNH